MPNTLTRILDAPDIHEQEMKRALKEPYAHKSYPKTLYKPEDEPSTELTTAYNQYGNVVQVPKMTQKRKTVRDAESHMKALRDGWFETPECNGRRRKDPKVMPDFTSDPGSKGDDSKSNESSGPKWKKRA